MTRPSGRKTGLRFGERLHRGAGTHRLVAAAHLAVELHRDELTLEAAGLLGLGGEPVRPDGELVHLRPADPPPVRDALGALPLVGNS